MVVDVRDHEASILAGGAAEVGERPRRYAAPVGGEDALLELPHPGQHLGVHPGLSLREVRVLARIGKDVVEAAGLRVAPAGLPR